MQSIESCRVGASRRVGISISVSSSSLAARPLCTPFPRSFRTVNELHHDCKPTISPCVACDRPQPRSHRNKVAVKSAASAGDAAAAPEKQPINWRVPAYIFLWYAFSIIFNVLNKATLNTFPCPWLISTIQVRALGEHTAGSLPGEALRNLMTLSKLIRYCRT